MEYWEKIEERLRNLEISVAKLLEKISSLSEKTSQVDTYSTSFNDINSRLNELGESIFELKNSINNFETQVYRDIFVLRFSVSILFLLVAAMYGKPAIFTVLKAIGP